MCLSHKEAAGYTDEIYWESVPTQLQTMCLMSEHLHTVILKLFYFLVCISVSTNCLNCTNLLEIVYFILMNVPS